MTDPTNPAPPAEELREVTQSDREAAADLVRWQRAATSEWKQDGGEAWQFFVSGFSRGIRQGIWDDHHIIQAFARHRLDHLSVLTVENERLRKMVADLECELGINTERNAEIAAKAGAPITALEAAVRATDHQASSLPAMKGEG